MAQNPKRRRKAKIVSLHGVSYAAALGPEKSVITFLEGMLNRAKKGEFIGVAFAGVQPGGRIEENWEVGRAGRHFMVAAVQSLHYNLMKASFGNEE